MSAPQAWGPGPFDNDIAQEKLRAYTEGDDDFDAGELESWFAADTAGWAEGQQTQILLAAIVAQVVSPAPLPLPRAADELARRCTSASYRALALNAQDCINRLLNDPSLDIWKGWEDGGISIRRQARALRARLHRSLSSD